MKTLAWVVLGATVLAAPVVSFGDQPVWPAGAQEKSDARVIAFYNGVCTEWADRQGLTGKDRDAYLAECPANAAAVFPVGYEEGGGGGGDE